MADWLLANTPAAVLVLSALLSFLSALFQVLGWTGASKVVGTLAVADLGRVIRATARSIKARRIITNGSLLLIPIAIVGCTAAQRSDADRLAEVCPVPAVKAAIAAGQTALAIVEAVCTREHPKDCEQHVEAARATLERAETTRRDVCTILPALRAVPCEDCTPAIEQAAALACEAGE